MALDPIQYKNQYDVAGGAANAAAGAPSIIGKPEELNIFQEAEKKEKETIEIKPEDKVDQSSHANATNTPAPTTPWDNFQFGDLLTKPESTSEKPDPDLSGITLFADIDKQQSIDNRNDLIKEVKIEEDTRMQEEQKQEQDKETAHLFAYV